MKHARRKKEQLLYRVMLHFKGIQKVEFYDLLNKIELLLYYGKSPLKVQHIKRIIDLDINQNNEDTFPINFTILPNGNFCELEGVNNWIKVYRETKRGVCKLNPITTYFFKTKYSSLELLKLTKKNLLEKIKNTQHQKEVQDFLLTNSISAKDFVTGKLLLLNLKIDKE